MSYHRSILHITPTGARLTDHRGRLASMALTLGTAVELELDLRGEPYSISGQLKPFPIAELGAVEYYFAINKEVNNTHSPALLRTSGIAIDKNIFRVDIPNIATEGLTACLGQNESVVLWAEIGGVNSSNEMMFAYHFNITIEQKVYDGNGSETVLNDPSLVETLIKKEVEKGLQQGIQDELKGKVDKVDGKSLIADKEIERLAKVNNYDDTNIKKSVQNLENNKVDKVSGKSLVSDTEIARLANVENYDDTAIKKDIADIREDISNIDVGGGDVDLTNYYTKEEIDKKGFLTEEKDPNISAWAKAESKPDYDYSEIKNTPDLSGFAKQGDVNTALGKKADKSELFSGSYNDLSDKPTIPSVAGLASENYVDNAVKDKANKSELFSGNYADLSGKPTIPAKTSDLTNDSDFTTKAYVDGLVGDINSVLDAINGEVI